MIKESSGFILEGSYYIDGLENKIIGRLELDVAMKIWEGRLRDYNRISRPPEVHLKADFTTAIDSTKLRIFQYIQSKDQNSQIYAYYSLDKKGTESYEGEYTGTRNVWPDHLPKKGSIELLVELAKIYEHDIGGHRTIIKLADINA